MLCVIILTVLHLGQEIGFRYCYLHHLYSNTAQANRLSTILPCIDLKIRLNHTLYREALQESFPQ